MTHEFIIAIRNDRGQILVLETLNGTPVLPSGTAPLDQGPITNQADKQVGKFLGIALGNLHLSSTDTSVKDWTVHYLTATVLGGKLVNFPHGTYASASWVAIRLAPKIQGLSPKALQALKQLDWLARTTYQRAPELTPSDSGSKPQT